MSKEFVTYDIAEKLKNLGFNEPCFATYFNVDNLLSDKDTSVYSEANDHNKYETRFSAPTWQSAFEWLRNTHNLHGEVHLLAGSNVHGLRKKGFEKVYLWFIHDLNEKRWSDGETVSEQFYSVRDAEIDCLQKLIGLAKEKKK